MIYLKGEKRISFGQRKRYLPHVKNWYFEGNVHWEMQCNVSGQHFNLKYKCSRVHLRVRGYQLGIMPITKKIAQVKKCSVNADSEEQALSKFVIASIRLILSKNFRLCQFILMTNTNFWSISWVFTYFSASKKPRPFFFFNNRDDYH